MVQVIQLRKHLKVIYIFTAYKDNVVMIALDAHFDILFLILIWRR